VFALGSLINAAAIILGGTLGLLIRRDLPIARQNQLRSAVGLGVVLAGFHLVWTGLREMSFGGALGLLGIALLATSLGRWLGRLLKFQAGMNRLGKFAGETFTKGQQRGGSVGLNDGFMACVILFCISPLSLLGPVQEGLNGDCFVLGVKAVMDGLAAFAFARVFRGGVLLAGLPVFALQGTVTLLVAWLAKSAPVVAMPAATNVTAGLLVVCAMLLVFDVRKVPLGDFLPALVVAPALAWLFF